jgi:hypothetical protein
VPTRLEEGVGVSNRVRKGVCPCTHFGAGLHRPGLLIHIKLEKSDMQQNSSIGKE